MIPVNRILTTLYGPKTLETIPVADHGGRDMIAVYWRGRVIIHHVSVINRILSDRSETVWVRRKHPRVVSSQPT